MKHYQVRFYPNNTFKAVETESFHDSHKTSLFSSYNGDTGERYQFMVCDEKSIEKTKKKIANYLIKEARKEFNTAKQKLETLEKLL